METYKVECVNIETRRHERRVSVVDLFYNVTVQVSSS